MLDGSQKKSIDIRGVGSFLRPTHSTRENSVIILKRKNFEHIPERHDPHLTNIQDRI